MEEEVAEIGAEGDEQNGTMSIVCYIMLHLILGLLYYFIVLGR